MQTPIKLTRPPFNSTTYREESETLILGVTIVLVLGVIALTSAATLCGSALFMFAILALSYSSTRSHHAELLQNARRVTPDSTPGLAENAQVCAERLQVEPVDLFVVRQRALNAYTFGLSSPKAVVLFEPLFQVMDRDEIMFIIGHEMGHVRLGHTWLNSLVGGMAGIPASVGAALILVLALRSWNKACEFSADRAGMLACANPAKAVSALVKLEAGPQALNPANMQAIMARIEAQDDDWMNNLGELFTTHPMIVKRIQALRKYARSDEYRRLQAGMDGNLE